MAPKIAQTTAPMFEPAITHETLAGLVPPSCTHGSTASCCRLPPMQLRKETAYMHGEVGPRVTCHPTAPSSAEPSWSSSPTHTHRAMRQRKQRCSVTRGGGESGVAGDGGSGR